MADDKVHYDLCPETGIGSLIINKDDVALKFDLMPDEATDLREKVRTGDIEGARELLVGVLPQSAEALKSIGIEDLSGEIK